MKVNTIDCIWAVLSVGIVGITYHFGVLGYGVLIVYALMDFLFMIHVLMMKKKMSGSIAVFGIVAEYHQTKDNRHFYPVLKYVTEEGREITSVYIRASREQEYEINDEEMICYSPGDPMFFYFASRENEMTSDYYRYMLVGGIAAGILFFIFQ